MIPLAILSNLIATELSTLCPNPNNCTLATPQSEVTNHGIFTSSNLITINTRIDKFINYGTISNGIYITSTSYALDTLTNYGEMRGVWGNLNGSQQLNITLNNLGTLRTTDTSNSKYAHFYFNSNNANIAIQNHLMVLRESQGEFNGFSGYTNEANKNSHLIIVFHNYTPTAQNLFKDSASKIILDFGDGFELGKGYAISKLVTDEKGERIKVPGVDFSRLTTRSELYTLSQSGNNFIVNLANSKTAGYSTIGNLYKSNIRTMNSFYTMSNSMIYPHKFAKKRVVKKRRVRRIKRTAESLLQSAPSIGG